jgi:hypothetical protein
MSTVNRQDVYTLNAGNNNVQIGNSTYTWTEPVSGNGTWYTPAGDWINVPNSIPVNPDNNTLATPVLLPYVQTGPFLPNDWSEFQEWKREKERRLIEEAERQSLDGERQISFED